MKINKVGTMIRIKELKEEISKIDGEILILQSQMEKAMKPFEEKIDKLSKQRNELQNELNRLKHAIEYTKFEEFVKYRKDKMTLKELILKGEGTFGDYMYFLPSGTAVKPSIFLSIKREFENLEEFAKYLGKSNILTMVCLEQLKNTQRAGWSAMRIPQLRLQRNSI